MRVGIPKETWPGETRVAVIPAGAAALKKAGVDVAVETGAGAAAGFTDDAYVQQGAAVLSRAEIFEGADILLTVRATPPGGALRAGQAIIGFADPLGAPEAIHQVAATGATLLSMELMPRITRAQSMDALSSMATIAGYKGVLLAANASPRMFPMLMTAAGTDRLRPRVHRRRRRRRAAGDCDGQAARREGRGLRRPAGGQGAGAEPRREVRRAADRVGGLGGQGRLREGAGRNVLPPAARNDAQGGGGAATS